MFTNMLWGSIFCRGKHSITDFRRVRSWSESWNCLLICKIQKIFVRIEYRDTNYAENVFLTHIRQILICVFQSIFKITRQLSMKTYFNVESNCDVMRLQNTVYFKAQIACRYCQKLWQFLQPAFRIFLF